MCSSTLSKQDAVKPILLMEMPGYGTQCWKTKINMMGDVITLQKVHGKLKLKDVY